MVNDRNIASVDFMVKNIDIDSRREYLIRSYRATTPNTTDNSIEGTHYWF